MNRYLETRMEHVTNVCVANLRNLCPDFRYIVVCQFSLPGCLVLSNAQSQAWISLDEPTINGLLHEDAQNMDFIERRIMDGRPASVRWPLCGAPHDVVEAVLPTKGLGACDLPLTQEQTKGHIGVEHRSPLSISINEADPIKFSPHIQIGHISAAQCNTGTRLLRTGSPSYNH